MSWLTPPTFVNGELSADQLNALRDNLNDLDTRLRLHGIDSATVLGALVGARYAVKLTKANQTIPDATDQLVYWDTEVYDDDGFWTVSNPARVTIPEDGQYVIKVTGLYEADGGGSMRGLEIYIDGANYVPDRRALTGAAFQCSVRCEDELYLTAGKEIYVRARHNAGHTVDLDAEIIVRRVAKTA